MRKKFQELQIGFDEHTPHGQAYWKADYRYVWLGGLDYTQIRSRREARAYAAALESGAKYIRRILRTKTGPFS